MTSPAGRLAPAKVNLGLRVVGRREDGYHLLESLFAPLELGDRLWVRIERAPASEVSLAVSGATEGIPAGGDNLVVRAARAFLAEAGLTARIAIELEKRVPAGAGLGGGSSDAATVLLALADHFANAVAPRDLARLALGLGADVPFFLDPRPAQVTGVGEQIEPLDDFPALHLLLVTPAPPLPTAQVFRSYAALTPAGPSRRMPALRGGPGRILVAALASEEAHQIGFDARSIRELQELLANDLEPVAARLHPAVLRVRAELERLGARAVAMSGSGPTLFGLFRSSEQARAAGRQGRFDATDRVLVTRTIGAPPTAGSGAGSRWGVV